MTLPELAASLIAIPSHESPTAAGDAIEDWLRDETSAAVRRDAVGNVMATRGRGTPDLALVGHHDVVPPAPSQTDDGNYTVERRDGRIYGRGSADMKGSLAAAMRAFRDADPAGTLGFASFVGEETGGRGAEHAIDKGYAPETAVVLEGSTGYTAQGVTDVVVAHNGRRGSRLNVAGTAAHASEPEAGDNAIYNACEAIARIREFDAPTIQVAGQSLSGSIAATGIDGGTAENMIPDACEITIDERTVPGEKAPLDRLEQLPAVSVTVDRDVPPMRCDDAMFAGAALDAAGAGQSGNPSHATKPHATDAGRLSDAGVTCVVIGASEPGEAHTKSESVGISAINRCERIYRTLAERWPATSARD